jgi:hypothetical protein
MNFSIRGLLVFFGFAAVLALALAGDARLGLIAVVAWLVIEGLLWSGVFGFGRGQTSDRA